MFWLENIFIIIGVLISVTSLGVVFFSKNKTERNITNVENDKYNVELEYRDLRNDIRSLTKEFNRTANFNTNLLDEKITYIKEIRDDLEAKEYKINKIMTDMEIMYNRLAKLVSEVEDKKILSKEYEERNVIKKADEKTEEKVIKMVPKQSVKKQGINDIEDEIIEYYKNGFTIKEISNKTGRSLGEIEFIMGLRKMN